MGLGFIHGFRDHTWKVVGLQPCFSRTDLTISSRTPPKRVTVQRAMAKQEVET